MPESPPATKAEPLAEHVPRLLSSIGVDEPFQLQRLPGGGNNRVFRVEAGDRAFLLKSYFSHPDDPRDRLHAEFAFTQFAWQHSIRAVAEPLASAPECKLGLYEFIHGRQLTSDELSEAHIDAALDFYHAVNRHKQTPAALELPTASEAQFSIAGQLAGVEGRVQLLQRIDPSLPVHRDALKFVKEVLYPAWTSAVRVVQDAANRESIPLDSLLTQDERCLSPSDFGFHNTILSDDGKLRFIDFEYAGWDDPAKMVWDFFLHVHVPVPERFAGRFLSSVLSAQTDPDRLRRRIQLLFPIFRIKWCCILLNEFVSTSADRRKFSGRLDAPDERKAFQLQQAQRILEASVEALT